MPQNSAIMTNNAFVQYSEKSKLMQQYLYSTKQQNVTIQTGSVQPIFPSASGSDVAGFHAAALSEDGNTCPGK